MAKLIDFRGGIAKMAHFGLEPAFPFNITTIMFQLSGSLAIIFNRFAGNGALALAVFIMLGWGS